MVNNNKILTVSYGTFSCTLEGFDDSFDTMKAIAEYFRDLAADDRYFGAEPPQPDADMLARIAQREITRRVEAHSENGGIVLRAQDETPAPSAAKATAISAPVAAATAKQDGEEDAADAEAHAPVAEEAVAEEAVADTPVEVETAPVEQEAVAPEAAEAPDTAEEPDTAQAEMEEGAESAPVEDIAPVEEPVQEPVEEIAEIEDAAPAVEDDDADMDAVAEDAAEDEDDGDDSAFGAEDYAAVAEAHVAMEEDAADDITQDDTAEDIAPVVEAVEDTTEVAPAPVSATSSIADKLRRIRAVVSRSEKATPEEPYLEDEHAEDAVEDVHIAAEDSTQDVMAVAQDDMSDDTEDEGDDATETHTNLFAEDDSDDTEGYDADEDEDDFEDVSPLRARVLKVNRADLEAAIAEGDLEEVDEDVAEAAKRTLSDEEEAELQRELAEVQADAGDDAEDDEAETVALDDAEDDSHHGAKVLSENTDADEDLSRLMAETEQQMGEPEGSQRRDAFAHLRAAVAATKAEETLGTGDKDKDSADAYRDDLASVVKPRRPETSGSRTERPSTDARPAPLKLVAEQRIDVEDAETRGPVRPRRIASNVLQSGSVTVEEETDDFVEFAQNVGATKLPEVIEAAAAFIAYVEGRDQFSRPQLMGKVRQVEKEGYSREDGLRAFGLLLRSGKIEKIKGGRFVVSDKIGFKPEAEQAREVG